MIKNTQLTDLGAVSAEFPYGFPKIESSTGLNDGTRFDDKYMNDMYQLFQRAAALSGITPNELLDNAVNGYQLFDACFGTPKVAIVSFGANCGNTGYAGETPLRIWKENGGKTLRINGHIAINNGVVDNQTVFSLPAGYRPAFNFTDFAVGVSGNQLDQKLIYDRDTFNVSLSSVPGGIVRQYINWSIPLD